MTKRLWLWCISLKSEARFLGWVWVIGYRILKRIGFKEIGFRVPGLRSKVQCRIEGSDIYEFKQSLGDRVEAFDLGYMPTVIVDAGANVGYTALRFQKQFPGTRIIAIEPEPRNIAQFQKNCSAYSNISLLPGALWTQSKTLRIESMDVSSNAFQVIEDPSGDIAGISVMDLIKTFDLKKIDLLKIDIEGSEKHLFDDEAAKLWLPYVRAMLIETHDETLGISGCSASVKKATADLFIFKGHVNEYEYFIARQSE